MAKFTPEKITTKQVDVTEEGLKLDLTLPPKEFKSGKKGFFKQGLVEASNGKKYRLNFQAYEA
jgi:hypothetical protein